jgi:hypothetical protein
LDISYTLTGREVIIVRQDGYRRFERIVAAG